MSAVVEVDRLEKRYGDQWAVRDVSFAVNEGEIFGILGPNGAGKTTTVECLQGLRSADRGSISILGHAPSARDRYLRTRVGSQLQDANLPDRIKVGEALRLFADTGFDISHVLQTWGLAQHERKAFGDLSGGLRQRLFIALALLNDPDVVFFDELTQGLDPTVRHEVWDVIRNVRSRGATVVLVTHLMNEAEALCDRLAIFDDGRIIAQGTPASIVADHAEHTTISFTTPPEPVQLERCPGVRRVSTRGGSTLIEGTSTMVPYVCAALVQAGAPPHDLRIDQPSLEDAVLALENGSSR